MKSLSEILDKEELSAQDIKVIKKHFEKGFGSDDVTTVIETEAELELINKAEFEIEPDFWAVQLKKLKNYVFTLKGELTSRAKRDGFLECDKVIIDNFNFATIIGFSSKHFAWRTFIGEPVYSLDYMGKTLQYCFENNKITFVRRYAYGYGD